MKTRCKSIDSCPRSEECAKSGGHAAVHEHNKQCEEVCELHPSSKKSQSRMVGGCR